MSKKKKDLFDFSVLRKVGARSKANRNLNCQGYADDYTEEQWEFILALNTAMRTARKSIANPSLIFEVLHRLGYSKAERGT
jgi:hypothetical protein